MEIVLLGSDLLCFQIFLNVREEHFYRIEPGRILGIEEHIHFKLASSLHDFRMLMNDSIIHQQNDFFVIEVLVSSDASQSLVDEIFEYNRVKHALYHLGSHHSILSNCSNKGH